MRNEETIELEHMAAKSQTQNEWSVEPEGNTERVECRTSGVWREREKHRSCGVRSQRERHTKLNTLGE